MAGRVLVVTGPGGAGKTTLATAVAERLGWVLLSEDEAWVAHGWSGLRTAEQEAVVQADVGRAVLDALDGGRGVVLELILYRPPPNPVSAYQDLLDAHGVPQVTVVLRPSVDEILRRMVERGRPTDLADLDGRRWDAEWQLAVIDGGAVDPAWIVDPTGPLEGLVDECERRVRRAGSP